MNDNAINNTSLYATLREDICDDDVDGVTPSSPSSSSSCASFASLSSRFSEFNVELRPPHTGSTRAAAATTAPPPPSRCIDFTIGQPSPWLLPRRVFAHVMPLVFGSVGVGSGGGGGGGGSDDDAGEDRRHARPEHTAPTPLALQYHEEPGHESYRRLLAAFLTSTAPRAVRASETASAAAATAASPHPPHTHSHTVLSDEVMATAGNSAAIALLCTTFARQKPPSPSSASPPGSPSSSSSHRRRRRPRYYRRPLVLVEDPTYFLALGIFRDCNVDVVGVRVDGDGVCVDELARVLRRCREQCAAAEAAADAADVDAAVDDDATRESLCTLLPVMPSLLYTIPTFHNPTAVTLTRARRRRLVALAREYDMLVVADEPYTLLHFDDDDDDDGHHHHYHGSVGDDASHNADEVNSSSSQRRPESLIYTPGAAGVVVSCGTFSKLLAPALRCGWLHAAPSLIAQLCRSGVLVSGGAANGIGNLVAAQVLRLGLLTPHVETVRRVLRRRCAALTAALDAHLNGSIGGSGGSGGSGGGDCATVATFTVPRGGYFVWVTLPPSVCVTSLLRRCRHEERGPEVGDDGGDDDDDDDDHCGPVSFCPGEACCVPSTPLSQLLTSSSSPSSSSSHSLRLSFAFYTCVELRLGVRRLARVLRAMHPGLFGSR